MYKGYSEKDIDIIVYPHKQKPYNKEDLVLILISLGYVERKPNTLFHDYGVDVWQAEKLGDRVDFFLLQRE